MISLSDEVYHTEEPSSSDSSIVKPITIVRTGDLSRVTIVRISTSDDTATAGLDYKPKTEMIKFVPGVSALDFEIEIFHDDEKEDLESFRVMLGPQDPVSGMFGKIKSAAVIIRDSFLVFNQSSPSNSPNKSTLYFDPVNQLESRFNIPYIDSLYYFALLNSTLNNDINEINYSMVPNGEPLICLEVSLYSKKKRN